MIILPNKYYQTFIAQKMLTVTSLFLPNGTKTNNTTKHYPFKQVNNSIINIRQCHIKGTLPNDRSKFIIIQSNATFIMYWYFRVPDTMHLDHSLVSVAPLDHTWCHRSFSWADCWTSCMASPARCDMFSAQCSTVSFLLW